MKIQENMRINKANAQSLLEYALLIITVASAIVAMSVYINRAVNSKLHDVELEMNPSQNIVVEP